MLLAVKFSSFILPASVRLVRRVLASSVYFGCAGNRSVRRRPPGPFQDEARMRVGRTQHVPRKRSKIGKISLVTAAASSLALVLSQSVAASAAPAAPVTH